MDSKGVLMTFPMNTYLEEKLKKHFKLFKLWTFEDKRKFFNDYNDFIRAVACNSGRCRCRTDRLIA